MNVDLVLNNVEKRKSYVLLLSDDSEVTEELVETLHSQNILTPEGYLTVKSYNTEEKLFTLSIIQSFVNRIGIPVTQNGMMIVGELSVMKQLFMLLNKRYKGE